MMTRVPKNGQEDPDSQDLIALRDVGKTFSNGTTALEGLNVGVRRGEFVSILGSSGCGKTTILRIVSGLVQPSCGTVVSPVMSGVADHSVGYVFQEPTLMPWATVFGNVFLPLRIKGVGAREAASEVENALRLVGLDDVAAVYPRALSGGMKMRVSIARALVTKPKVLLMDEPFAALDEITRFRLNNDFLNLWYEFGWTVVFVTHSVFESVYMSGRILIMASQPGRIVGEISNDTGYPRGDDYRTSAKYSNLCRETSRALTRALGPEERR